MTLIDILLTTLAIALFCLGIRTLLSDGQILHSIRQPFENKKRLPGWTVMIKPVILCVVCFPSVWGSLLFVLLHGIQWQLIPCIISASFLIKAINDKVEF